MMENMRLNENKDLKDQLKLLADHAMKEKQIELENHYSEGLYYLHSKITYVLR